ncbi:MAG: bifunctional DNA primase/polymerase [Geminicoccaceae bacterium]|nr:bifunctional DNA primase/polymerase [Geminicoccaceae bacterium]
MPSLVARWALRYRERGWSVIPLRPRDKRPLLRWEAFQHRRPEPEEIRAWFATRPDANLGVVTGTISGLVVLDVDPARGGNESLAALEARFGPLPPTLVVETGGGGRHLYFHHPGGLPCAVGIRPGLDLRGEGGYVVAPPSIHPNGRPYRFLPGPEGELPEPAPLPGWLALPLDESAHRRGHSVAWWRALLREGLVEGERNTRLASLAGLLLHHGLEPGVVEELLQGFNLGRCRPPLPPEEVHAVVASICRTRERAARRAALARAATAEPARPSVASPGTDV